MSSQMNVGLKYNAEEREKAILSGLEEDFDPKIIDKILSEAIPKSSVDLTGIGRDFEQLEEEVHSIKADGTANKYLIYEDRCRKLLTKLDGIHLDSEGDISTRKTLIDRIISCSTLLKKSSIENLKNLLLIVKKLDVSKVHQPYFQKVDKFIDQSSGSTITEVDEYRYKLEDIKQNMVMESEL